jgi:cytochrome bd ubiquinol oxidase subunit II
VENIINFQILWFVLVVVLFMGYSLLDGFDLGAAALLRLLGRKKEEKDLIIGAISPVWDGNEVWLITGGGALFAAFPQAYATAFSGFYLAMMLVLFSLIFRAVSMEFRAHDEKRAGVWEISLSAGSWLAALLFGVALGNVVYGVPLDNKMEFTGNFFTLLRPVPLLFGITGLAAVLMQGVSYIIMKTKGKLRDRAFKTAGIIWGAYLLLTIVFASVLAVVFPGVFNKPVFRAGLGISAFSLAYLYITVKRKNDSLIFWIASLAFTGLWMMVAAAHFPNLIKASNDPALSITIYNASTAIKTLKIMSVIALAGMPVVIAYTIIVYGIFKGKTKLIKY